MTPLLRVRRSHGGVLLQDGGRLGAQATGYVRSGVLDLPSAWLAQALVGNVADSAEFSPAQFYRPLPCIEITGGNVEFECLSAMTIAHVGALGPLFINEVPAAVGQALRVNAGDVLRIGFYRLGLRGYLAIAGRLQLEMNFASCARVDASGRPKPLQDGEILYGNPSPNASPLPAKRRHSLPYSIQHALLPPPSLTLDYLPLAASFDADNAQQQLAQKIFKVSAHSNRMGVRLQGAALAKPQSSAMYSEALSLGTIQLPANGQPIVLLNDHQTIGGYPRIGTVASYSLYALAQQRPGQFVRFQAVDLATLQHKRDICWRWLWQQLAKFTAPDTAD